MNDYSNIVNNFEILFKSGVLNIENKYKLDVFWHITSEAKKIIENDSKSTPSLSSDSYFICQTKLKEMGLNENDSFDITRQSFGDIQQALVILGWI